MSKLTPFLIAWGILAAAVAVLAVIRWRIGIREDDVVHLGGSDQVLKEQVEVGKEIDKVAKWGEALTVALVVTGLMIGAYWLYLQFVGAGTKGFE